MDSERKKTSFVVYREWMQLVMGLPDDQALDLARAIFAYCLGQDYNPGGTAAAIFATIQDRIDEDVAEWERICELRRQAGSKGGKQKQANAKQMLPNANQMLPNAKQMQADNDNEYEYEYDNGNDNDVLTDKKKVDAKASKKETVDALIAKWNSYADRGSIPCVRSVTRDGSTWRSILARVDEKGLDTVFEVMDMVFESDYLKGKKNGWFAKFDWMFNRTNFDKILNGNYTDKGSTQTQAEVLAGWLDERKETKPIW